MPCFKVKSQKSKIKSTNEAGFSLIELMVALIIIALVSAAGLYTASSILTSNRNTQRTSDLKLIQVTLQQYYADLGFFPCSIPTNCRNNLVLSGGGQINNCTGRNLLDPACTVSTTYLSVIPTDPKQIADNTIHYCYEAQVSRDNPDHTCDNSSGKQCKYYRLYAVIEPEGSTHINCQDGATVYNRPNYSVEPL